VGLWLFLTQDCRAMEFLGILKEFLESSTIHGLIYISTAKVGDRELGFFTKEFPQTKSEKLLWFFVVCIGFLTAGYLINSSYAEWRESPILTSLSTHPIARLAFPNVTVCPPKGFNTNLNYDLLKADNTSLNETDRERLKNDSEKIFLIDPHMDYLLHSM
jgi:hypothetical protein